MKLPESLRKLNISLSDIFAAFCTAFILSGTVFALCGDFRDLLYVRRTPLIPFVLITSAVFACLFFVSQYLKTAKIIKTALLISAAFFSVVLVTEAPGEIFFNIGVSAALMLCLRYCLWDGEIFGKVSKNFNKKTALILTVAMFLVYTAAVFVLTAFKYRSYSHSTFDFGIFCQMFEQMVKTGLPHTTVERGVELSHFAVHFSPIFYVLLPGYYIFRSPLYLLLCQAAITGAGVFPVRGICKKLGFSEKATLAASAVYLLYPTVANGTFYDFHENKFLTVLILCTVYFVLSENRLGIGIFAFLTLTVKEDAFIYVFAIALWMIFSKRDRLFGVLLAFFSVGYFLFACEMIRLCGGEIMSTRFENLSADPEGGLLGAVKTAFLDAGYIIREIFNGADTEGFSEVTYTGQKLEFVLWTCTPLLFLPFAGKKKTDLLLLIPMAVINLIPDWMYQSDVDYQYTYGTVALLFFMALICLSEMKPEKRRFCLVSMLLLCTVFSASLTLPKAERYAARYAVSAEAYSETDEALKTVPADKSVTAYGYMMPHMAYIDSMNTCPEYYKELTKTDYYIVDSRYEYDSHTEKMFRAMGDDYELVCVRGFAKIYKLKSQ